MITTPVPATPPMAGPPNDNCMDASELSADGFEVIGTTTNANIDANYDSCAFRGSYSKEINIQGASVWYTIVGTGERIVVTTCSPQTSIDTVVAVYTDDNCGLDECEVSIVAMTAGKIISDPILAANDNDDLCTLTISGASTVVWDSVQGKRYKLYVSNKYGRLDGTFGVRATSMAAPPNDNCMNALELATDGVEVIGTTTNATIDANYDSCAFRGSYSKEINIQGASVWYTIVGTGERIVVTTCSPQTSIDTVVAVYTDDNCGFDECEVSIVTMIDGKISDPILAANDNDDLCTLTISGASTVVWDSVQGKRYKLYVSNKYGRDDGTFGIKATASTAPPNGIA